MLKSNYYRLLNILKVSCGPYIRADLEGPHPLSSRPSIRRQRDLRRCYDIHRPTCQIHFSESSIRHVSSDDELCFLEIERRFVSGGQ